MYTYLYLSFLPSSYYFHREFDDDAGGSISRDEYVHLHKDLQRNGLLLDLDADQGLEALDANKDGTIQFNEVCF